MAEKNAPLIVVIDDEEDVVLFLRLALEDNGYRVTATTRAADALELIRESRPAAALLDLVMPERTGLSVYAEILQEPELSDLKVVFLSAINLGQEFQERLGTEGALPLPAGFVEKPIDLESLLATLESILAPYPQGAEGVI